MPIYEYRCGACGREFECLVTGSYEPECPHCQSRDLTRTMSACRFVSKGKGGQTVKSTASACGGCSASTCAGCNH
ncbi:MAG: zinc ribbon domain-containing protein [Desulfobacterales bacterium]|nr:zinc ribbon domain-containing protein [Desulfobacterales bacterium]